MILTTSVTVEISENSDYSSPSYIETFENVKTAAHIAHHRTRGDVTSGNNRNFDVPTTMDDLIDTIIEKTDALAGTWQIDFPFGTQGTTTKFNLGNGEFALLQDGKNEEDQAGITFNAVSANCSMTMSVFGTGS